MAPTAAAGQRPRPVVRPRPVARPRPVVRPGPVARAGSTSASRATSASRPATTAPGPGPGPGLDGILFGVPARGGFVRGLPRVGDQLRRRPSVFRQQGVERGPGSRPLPQMRFGRRPQLGDHRGAQQVPCGEAGECGQGVGGGARGADQRGRVEEARRHHALGPRSGAVVQLLLGQAPFGRCGVPRTASAGPPGLVQDAQPERVALRVARRLVPGQLLAGLGHERGRGMGRGEGVDVMDVRLGEQVAQGAGATGAGEQRGQPGGVLVRLALRTQPAGPVAVRGGQGLGDRVDGGPAQPGGHGGVVEQSAHGVRAAPLPDPQQRVLLGDLPHAQPEGRRHELRVARTEQWGQPGAGDLAVRCRQLGAQGAVERHGVDPFGDGAAQGLGGARVAVDGRGDPGVADRGQPGEDPGVEPGMAGQGCPGAGVPVVEDGPDQAGRRQCPAGQQLRRHRLGQGGERGRCVLRLRMLEEQAERVVDTAGRGRAQRVVGPARRRRRGEQLGQSAAVPGQGVVQRAPAGAVRTEVPPRQLPQKHGRFLVGSSRGGDLGRHRARGPCPLNRRQRGAAVPAGGRRSPAGVHRGHTGPGHLAQQPSGRPHLRLRHGRHADTGH